MSEANMKNNANFSKCPHWLKELKQLLGDEIEIYTTSEQLRDQAESEVYFLAGPRLFVICRLPAEDPRRPFLDILLQRESESPLQELISGGVEDAADWSELLEGFRLALPECKGFFLILQFESAQSETELNEDMIQPFLDEWGQSYNGLLMTPFRGKLAEQSPNQMTWGIYLPDPEQKLTDIDIEKDMLGWIDLVNSEFYLKARIGIGNRCAHIRDAWRHFNESKYVFAQGARFLPQQRVYRYANLGVLHLFANLSDSDRRQFLKQVLKQDSVGRSLTAELRETASAFLENNLNLSETAKALYLHRNSLMYRLEKMNEITGLDIRTFSGAALIWLTLYLIGEEQAHN